jgi:hypothetical protein
VFFLFIKANSSFAKQPIQAFEHPTFQKMIQVSARATREVKVPNRQQTRAEIISFFKEHMHKLKARLNVRRIYHLTMFLLIYTRAK